MHQKKLTPIATLGLATAALGVILGDIGTSPLYSFKEVMQVEHMTRTSADVLGALSLFFWSLIMIGTVQYCWIFMRVHHDGEGGGLALYALLKKAKQSPEWLKTLVIIGIALTIADGIITPAISVMSAVEGLSLLTPIVEEHYIVPLSAWGAIAILALLFGVQKYGTQTIGRYFGPIMILWFLSIAGVGLLAIWQVPEVFHALNPYWGVNFVLKQSFKELLHILGSVALCVTGAEALYADRGHFTQETIRIAWGYALPCLVLNYFGQGALALSGAAVENNNYFFSLCPNYGILIYMLILATLATVIASQAMITGTFSLMKQAVNLDLSPRVKIIHTNPKHRTQIYLPRVNTMLGVGAILMVLFFQTSSNIASAYGISVFGAMLVTTTAYTFTAKRVLGQNIFLVLFLAALFFMADGVLFVANMTKFFSGGYISLAIALVFAWIMYSWQWGLSHVHHILYKFILTSKAMRQLREDGLPENILAAIQPLHNHKYAGNEEFLSALEGVIGKQQTLRYKSQIQDAANIAGFTIMTITEETLRNLADRAVSTEMLDKIRLLKGDRYTGKGALFRALEKTIGKELTEQYKSLVLQYVSQEGCTITELLYRSDTLIKRPCIIVCLEPVYSIEEVAPVLLQEWWTRYYALPEKMIFLYVHPEPIPSVPEVDRVRLLPIKGEMLGGMKLHSLEIFFGYMEEVDFPTILAQLISEKKIPDISWMVLWLESNLVTPASKRSERLLLDTFAFVLRESSTYIDSLNITNEIKTMSVKIDI